MNKSIKLAAVTMVAGILTASSVYAQMSTHRQSNGPSGMQGGGMQQGSSGMQGGGMMGGPGGGSQDPQSEANRKAEEELELKDRKAEMLLRINDHLAQIQKAQSCVQAAATLEALRSCGPGGGPGGGGMQGGSGGGGGMRGGQSGMQQGGPGGGMMGGGMRGGGPKGGGQGN